MTSKSMLIPYVPRLRRSRHPGVPFATALAWRTRELALVNNAFPALEKAAGDSLAGSWIEWSPGPTLVVAVAGRPTSEVAAVHVDRSLAAYVQVREARHTLDELLEARTAAVEVLAGLGAEGSVGVKESANSLVVHLEPSVENEANVTEAESVRLALAEVGIPAQVLVEDGELTPGNRVGDT